MLFLKVAAVITLIVSLLVSPSAQHPNGRRDLLEPGVPTHQTTTVKLAKTQCKATLKEGLHCIENATHNGYCAQHFKD